MKDGIANASERRCERDEDSTEMEYIDTCSNRRSREIRSLATPTIVLLYVSAYCWCPSTVLGYRNSAFVGSSLPSLRTRSSFSPRRAVSPSSSTKKRSTSTFLSHFRCQWPDLSVGSSPRTFYPEADRIIALGDVHGDAGALQYCLNIAGLIDESNNWIGGSTHLVQVGDILDRGNEDLQCLQMLLNLKDQAELAGGAVHILLGNHEVLNADWDFHYVGRDAWKGWVDPSKPSEEDPSQIVLKRDPWTVKFLRSNPLVKSIFQFFVEQPFPLQMRERAAAFYPGGFAARILAQMPVCVQIGDTVLVHGGLQMQHVEYGLESINHETAAWLDGAAGATTSSVAAAAWSGKASAAQAPPQPKFLYGEDSPVWMRNLSAPFPTPAASEELDQVLSAMGARRMVVGHTPQVRGINAHVTRLGNEVWRCDTGMSSSVLGGPKEVLEILADGRVNVITRAGAVPGRRRQLLTASGAPSLRRMAVLQ